MRATALGDRQILGEEGMLSDAWEKLAEIILLVK
jgi:hypothetical protein